MNNVHALTADNLLASLPAVLQEDEGMRALATAVADVLVQRKSELNRVLIYSRIKELPEDLLDILAYDFKVDWWDADYSLEEKRQMLAESWKVHRTLGTKTAVETAISAIYSDTKAVEWFEYGGEPYCFKLIIDATYESVDPKMHQRVIDKVDFYKNLRSHLDGIEYELRTHGKSTMYCGAAMCSTNIQITTGVIDTNGMG